QDGVLKSLVIWHWYIFLRYARDGRVKLIKNISLDAVADLCADSAERAILFNDNDAVGFSDRIINRLFVQWSDRSQIEHLGTDILIFKLLRNVERERHGLRITNNRHVRALPLHFSFA